MRNIYLSLLLVPPLLALAQPEVPDCFYQLQLRDAGGDGFGGGQVVVRIGEVSRRYTLNAMQDDGSTRDFFLPVENGEELTVDFESGALDEEVTLRLLDNADSLLYETTGPAASTELFRTTVSCRTCAPPPQSSIELMRVRFNSVDIRFRGIGRAADPTYVIEYGEGDFNPDADEGTTLTTRDTMLRIGGLESLTDYTFFISTRCGDADTTTVRRGPFRIRTQIENDLGVTVLRRPVEYACVGGGADSVTVGISNFGGAPQQFFEVDFEINGEAGGVNFPFDGVYTGVVGVDSTEFFTFDTRAALSEPGFYTFSVFTKLEGDQNPDNDALEVTVLRVPVIDSFPYAEGFERDFGFWTGARAGRGPSSWERGRPRAGVIDRAGSGEFAYVTNPRGPYNDRELSYLRSPCFDFSGLEEDPVLSFLLFVDTEEGFDQLYLESSVDGGENWDVVERNPTGINWYNNGPDESWDGNGGFGETYAQVSQQLRGLAGEREVQLRFVFVSDEDTRREGVAIDEIRIQRSAEVDLAAVTARLPDFDGCASVDTLEFVFTDLGRTRVDSATINYTLREGGEVTSVRVAAPTTLGGRRTVRLPLAVPFNPPSPVTVTAWISAEGDGNARNDTTVLVSELVREVPFIVDFDDGRRPADYTFESFNIVQSTVSEFANALAVLRPESRTAFIVSPFYGELQTGDSLSFIVSTEDNEDVQLVVLADEACNPEADTLLSTALAGGRQSIAIDLSAYAGSYARFTLRFVYSSGTNDVSLIVDDIAIRRCPADFDISISTNPPAGIFADDGEAFAVVRNGTPPYIYAWSNGDSGASADSLSVEEYSVTVTDALGCSAVVDFDVTLVATAVTDPDDLLAGLNVYPNPTHGQFTLGLTLPQPEELEWQLFDATGRRLAHRALGRTDALRESVDLDDHPPGLYLLYVRAGAAARTLAINKY